MPCLRVFQMLLNGRRAIFLDRDGTINADAGYTHRIEDWRFLPGVVEALAALKKDGWLLVVASNQSGIGRGYYTWEQLKKLEMWVNAELGRRHAAIDAWYYCPHPPDAGCACRKPEPGLLLTAARDLHIDLASSFMLGDKASDVEAGQAAGCQTGLITTRPELIKLKKPATHVWPDLARAVKDMVCGHFQSTHLLPQYAECSQISCNFIHLSQDT